MGMTILVKIAKKKQRLEMYYAAEEAILAGAQSYKLGSRSLTRADLSAIESMIKKLENDIEELEAVANGGSRRKAMAAVPFDW